MWCPHYIPAPCCTTPYAKSLQNAPGHAEAAIVYWRCVRTMVNEHPRVASPLIALVVVRPSSQKGITAIIGYCMPNWITSHSMRGLCCTCRDAQTCS